MFKVLNTYKTKKKKKKVVTPVHSEMINLMQIILLQEKISFLNFRLITFVGHVRKYQLAFWTSQKLIKTIFGNNSLNNSS